MAELIADNLVAVTLLGEGGAQSSASATGGLQPADLAGPSAIVVRWTLQPTQQGLLAQVYVNGALAASSDDPAQTELVVPLVQDGALIDWLATNVQVVAVEPSEASQDFSALLAPQARGCQALLSWPRSNNAPLGSTVNIFGDSNAGRPGEIDFTAPMNDQPIAWFPAGAGQWGFALDGFGQGDFGYDGQGSIGLGLGGFGIGEFGFDAAWASWLSPPLAAGTHQFVAVSSDPLGNAGDPSPPAQVTIAGPPPRIGNLSISGSAAGDAIVVAWAAGGEEGSNVECRISS